MYMHFYGLNERPFSTVPDTTFLFKSRQYLDAYNHLLYGIRSKQGFMALIGDVGTGKTTLCRALIHAMEGTRETALIFNPPDTEAELLKTILQDLGEVPFGTTKTELLDALNAYLLRCSAQGKGVIIIIDEAQNLGENVLEELRLLSNLETEKEKLIQIILSGQPELLKKLSRASLRQLYQRIAIWAYLKPLNKTDVGNYIHHRLIVAGAQDSITFTSPALQKIYRYSGGIPRKINLLCDKALLAGYAAQKKRISSRMVAEAIRNNYGEDRASYRLRIAPNYGLISVVIIACILITGLLQGDWNPWLVNNLAPEIHYARARAPDTFLRIPQSATAPAPQQESTQPQQPIAQLEFPRSGEFDAQGVVRQLQDASSECSVEALATLLALWDIPRETIVHELVQRPHTTAFSFSEAAQAFDLSVSPMEITLEQIKLLDYPCIVPLCDTPSRYVVLAKIVQDQVTILDPLKGKTVLSAEQFNSLWSRMAFFIWKDVDNLPPRLKKGDAHRQVVILKEKLAAKNFRVQLPLSDIFDQQLESAVRRLQTAYGLEADGIVGSRTKLAFYRIVYGSQLPNLQS